MLFFFKPRAYNGGIAPIPASIVGPWIVQELKKRKKRQEEEEQKKAKEVPTEVEKATEIAIETLREDSSPNYSKELEKQLEAFALASARAELLAKELEVLRAKKAVEEEIQRLNIMVQREIALEAERQRIAKKILEMQEEEEALLFLLMQ